MLGDPGALRRWLACDGNVSRIVVGPDGELLDLGRRHRVVPPPLRRAVEYRDRGCVFAGCDAPAHWCDVHHLVHWVDGGETSLQNSALLCERHSHLVSTTASGSNGMPRADGTPTGPTAPRS
ncbi:HNH endonuclease [Blastococcus sp. SYSU DS0619]